MCLLLFIVCGSLSIVKVPLLTQVVFGHLLWCFGLGKRVVLILKSGCQHILCDVGGSLELHPSTHRTYGPSCPEIISSSA